MTIPYVIASIAFLPALLVTAGNASCHLHNARGGSFRSSILVVPSILCLIPLAILFNVNQQLIKAGGHAFVRMKPFTILAALIVAADIPVLIIGGLIARARRHP